MEIMINEFHNIIGQFVEKYELTREQVIPEIERAFSITLSRWYKMEVITLYSGGRLQVFGYSKLNGCYELREFDLLTDTPRKDTLRGWNTIKREIEKNMLSAVNREKFYMHKNDKTIGWGSICDRVPGQKLIVRLKLAEKFEVYAECPFTKIGSHERLTSAFALGERRAFWVWAIHPVTLNGTPRLSVILNRTSKNLPASLLKEKMQDKDLTVGCSCRYPGRKSFLTTNRFIPKATILEIEDELREHIKITYEKSL